jgi:hypothetical protein
MEHAIDFVIPLVDPPRRRWLLALTWLIIAAMLCGYGYHLARAGIDLREDFWVYWQNNRFYSDLNQPLHHGRHVLLEAKAIERKDPSATPGSDDASTPTIARPGPGIFDKPFDLATAWHRWQRLRPVYGHIFRGWVATYDHLIRDEPGGNFEMDYPPLRSLVMTLWVWKVQADYPSLLEFPERPTQLINPFTHQKQTVTPDVVHPLLVCNTVMEAISSVAIFFLVWIWVGREGQDDLTVADWRLRWGDPLLLVPVIVLGIFTLLRSEFVFRLADVRLTASLIDDRVSSIGWWIFLLLRFTSVVSLARLLPHPFRRLACAVVAGSLAWINPATILVSFGWPQWDAWLLPFFLIPALLISIDWWVTAGLVLGVGCMFKGQLLFIAPMLVLCPLFAGWFGRFMRIVAGFAAGFGLVVWPWLVNNSRAGAYITAAVSACVLICALSYFRAPVRREILRLSKLAYRRVHARWSKSDPQITDDPRRPEIRWPIWLAISLSLVTATTLSMLIYRGQDPSMHKWTILLTLAILTIPWLIPRRHLPGWVTLIFASSLWLSAFSLGGSFSWWTVGFLYGTQKHQNMQLGNASLSNFSSILEHRYGWNLHDPVGTLHLPFKLAPIDLDVQSALATLFGLSLLLCTAAAALHLRRRDKKFLVAMVAPWILFVALLTQMAARYTVYPAVIACALVGVSVGMSLFQVLLVAVSFVMLGNQMLASDPQTAPILYAISRQTFPDMGWLMLLLAGVFLVSAMMPGTRGRRLLPPRHHVKSG